MPEAAIATDERCAGCQKTADQIKAARKLKVVVMVTMQGPKGTTWKMCVRCWADGLRDKTT